MLQISNVAIKIQVMPGMTGTYVTDQAIIDKLAAEGKISEPLIEAFSLKANDVVVPIALQLVQYDRISKFAVNDSSEQQADGTYKTTSHAWVVGANITRGANVIQANIPLRAFTTLVRTRATEYKGIKDADIPAVTDFIANHNNTTNKILVYNEGETNEQYVSKNFKFDNTLSFRVNAKSRFTGEFVANNGNMQAITYNLYTFVPA